MLVGLSCVLDGTLDLEKMIVDGELRCPERRELRAVSVHKCLNDLGVFLFWWANMRKWAWKARGKS